MAFAIMRFAKLKTWGNVSGVAGHHTRDHQTLNADPAQPNKWLAGPPSPTAQDIVEAVRARIGDRTVRKNAVLGLEFFLGASPAYFRPDDPGRPGHYDPGRVEAFNKAALAWLTETFGSANIISAVCHLDESTPHVQALVVPIDPDSGRLNASRWLDGKRRLAELQDSFALACWPLGLDRGIRGSKADHSRVAQYYGAVNAADAVAIPVAQVQPPPVMVREAAREKWAADESERINGEQMSVLQPVADAAADAHLAKRKRSEAESTLKALSAELEKARQDAALIRDVPLVDVLARAGYTKDSHGVWTGSAGRISITARGMHATYWNEDLRVGGRNAIDLARHLNGYDFVEAVAWLGGTVGRPEAVGAALAWAKQEAQDAIQSHPPTPRPPRPSTAPRIPRHSHLPDPGPEPDTDINPRAR